LANAFCAALIRFAIIPAAFVPASPQMRQLFVE